MESRPRNQLCVEGERLLRLGNYLVFVCPSKTEKREAKQTGFESTVGAAWNLPPGCGRPFRIFRRCTNAMTNIVIEITRLEIASQDNPICSTLNYEYNAEFRDNARNQ